MTVPSMKTMPNSSQFAAFAASKRRSQTPSLDQRRKVWAAIHHGPNSTGMARHLAPFCMRQTMASKVWRKLDSSRPVCGRTASITGSNAVHWASVKTGLALLRRYLDGDMPACSPTRKPTPNKAPQNPNGP